jgi:glutathione synthase/RimK-type ligase-like ATP-grasp enzyme
MILLWGLPQDEPLRLVRNALAQEDASFVFLNQADLLDTHVELEYSPTVTGILSVGGREYRLESIRAIYLRPYDFSEFPDLSCLDANSPQWRHAFAVEDALWGFAELAEAVVVNRPSAMQSNSSKPYQCCLIEAHGFKVPETLITTDASAARRFHHQHREVVYKSISSQRSIVNRLGDEHESRMADLRWCPTQFQCWVPGVDHRVHVVDEQVFTTRVLSDAVDYRYGFARMEPCQVPDDVAERCLSMARGLGLRLAGIDLRRTAEGEWVCFEVNPSPAYSCYEFPDRRISLAVARLLMRRKSFISSALHGP